VECEPNLEGGPWIDFANNSGNSTHSRCTCRCFTHGSSVGTGFDQVSTACASRCMPSTSAHTSKAEFSGVGSLKPHNVALFNCVASRAAVSPPYTEASTPTWLTIRARSVLITALPTRLNPATNNTSTASVSATVNVALPRSVRGCVFMLRRERERVQQMPRLVRRPCS